MDDRRSPLDFPSIDKVYTEAYAIQEGDMFRRSIPAVLLVLCTSFAAADEQPIRSAGRGELLYSTHCITCHDTQVHWREKKFVTNWPSLRTEVRRWQEISRLAWGDDDVAAVASYLNALHYRYPAPD